MVPLLYNPNGHRAERAEVEWAAEMLGSVGLGDRLSHRPNELSGGQQQRVAIARALINRPAILLADEPTGNLDTRSGEEIMQLLEQVHAEGATIVMVTHSPDASRHADRIVRLRDGLIDSDERNGRHKEEVQ